MIELTSKAKIRGLTLRSVCGGSRTRSNIVALTFDGGAPERDVHLLVWEQETTLYRDISGVGKHVGPLPLSFALDQEIVGLDEAA